MNRFHEKEYVLYIILWTNLSKYGSLTKRAIISNFDAVKFILLNRLTDRLPVECILQYKDHICPTHTEIL